MKIIRRGFGTQWALIPLEAKYIQEIDNGVYAIITCPQCGSEVERHVYSLVTQGGPHGHELRELF